MAVEGAQTGSLAMDRGRRGGAAVPVGEAGQEVGDVRARSAFGSAAALVKEAPILEEVGAVGLEGVPRQPALELEKSEEIEDQVFVRAALRGGCDYGHADGFGRPGPSPCAASRRSAA